MKRMQPIKKILVVAALAVFVASCSSDKSREDKVAAIISQIDSPMLIMNTSPGDIIEKSGSKDGVLPYTQEMLLGFFIDQETTGIDYATDVQIVIGSGSIFVPNFYGFFKLEDENVFVNLLETEINAKVEQKEGFKYVIDQSSPYPYVIVWDGDFAMFSTVTVDLMSMFGGGSSDEGVKAVDKLIAYAEKVDDTDINEDYLTFIKNESDISYQIIGEGLYAYMKGLSMGQSEELEANRELLEGINSKMYLDFNKGSIDFKLLTDLSDKVMEDLSFVKDAPISKDLMGYGNSANPIFTMSYNLDFAKFLAYSEEKMATYDFQELEGELENLGMSIEDAKNALSGEMLFIVDRLEMKEELIDWGYEEPYRNVEPMPIFGLVVGVNDESLVAEILSKEELSSEGVIKKDDIFIVMNGDVLFSTNDSVWASRVASNNTTVLNDPSGMLSENPFGMFLDMGALSKIEDLEDVQLYVDLMENINGGGNMGEVNVRMLFKDDSQNALRILTEGISSYMNYEMQVEEMDSEGVEELEAELEAAVESLVE